MIWNHVSEYTIIWCMLIFTTFNIHSQYLNQNSQSVSPIWWPWPYRTGGQERILLVLGGKRETIYQVSVTVMTLPTSHSNANPNPKLLAVRSSLVGTWDPPQLIIAMSWYRPCHHGIVNTNIMTPQIWVIFHWVCPVPLPGTAIEISWEGHQCFL